MMGTTNDPNSANMVAEGPASMSNMMMGSTMTPMSSPAAMAPMMAPMVPRMSDMMATPMMGPSASMMPGMTMAKGMGRKLNAVMLHGELLV